MLIYWAIWDPKRYVVYPKRYMGYMGNVKHVSSTAALFSGALLNSHYTECYIWGILIKVQRFQWPLAHSAEREAVNF